MNNIRWDSPFKYTLAFYLFKQHFREINAIYWSFVPASNTIKKLAKDALEIDDKDPHSYFLFPDAEDRHVVNSYSQWKDDYAKYINYSRMNIIMLLSSCFETYLRTVVSLAFESQPGVLIGCKEAVDGAKLLKHDITYGDSSKNDYRFKEAIEEVCQGDWTKRFSEFQKYFGPLPTKVIAFQADLDKLRLTRNNLGHYLGRRKKDYEAPILFKPLANESISHERIQRSFKLIYSVAESIDLYLHSNVIGSYDIIKKYFMAISTGEIVKDEGLSNSQQFKKMIGQNNLKLMSKTYYKEFDAFCETNYVENKEDCIFTKPMCIKEINRRLNDSGITLYRAGIAVTFGKSDFNKIVKKESIDKNVKYSKRAVDNKRQVQYLYSALLIDYITKKLESNSSLLDDLISD